MGVFKHHGLIEELREHGHKARAQILHSYTLGAYESPRALWHDDTDPTVGYQMVRLKLKVMPEGEESFETSINTRLQPLSALGRGDFIEVYYDPNDHDRVVFDYEEETKKAAQAAKDLVDDHWDPDSLDSFSQQKLDDVMERLIEGKITEEEADAEQAKIYREAKK
jgi:hypothetical protein